ncbi:MAG: FtsX-like permease family protein [Beijerinckiaceae bacterium]|nr:FtsX-like permease family protein [Brevundimonas sp.]MCZ8302012.1 FtsX-like permease family protein [Beijerinckiaceae bacterium]
MVIFGGMLNRKALRDFWALRTQVVSIALLIASGIAVFVMSASNYATLLRARNEHYAAERFADVFVSLKRAPLAIAERLRLIDGVGVLEARIAATIRIDDPSSALPVTGRMMSLPRHGQPALNRLVLRSGTWPDSARTDQVLVNEAFAARRGLRPGDSLRTTLNGRLQRFIIAGVALSPEFVFATRPGDPLPDDSHFAVLWAQERTLANTFDMFGAFNDLVLTLAPGANGLRVLAELDEVLSRFGSTGAILRRDHASDRFLSDELVEQRTLAVLAPAIFFGVAAFLLAVVVGRLVEAQRDQIASLKALGYPTGPILRHYFLLVSAIAVAGAGIGIVAGHVLAIWVVEAYRGFFRFPVMEHRLEIWAVLASFGVSLLVVLGAVTRSVTRIVLLPAMVAMRPAPPQFRAAALPDWLGLVWSTRSRMALRGIIGRPVRSALSMIGVGLAMPLIVLGLFWFDALDYMIDMTFERIQRGDVYVGLTEARSASALEEFRRLEGVMIAEGQRIVPVILRSEHRTYRASLSGLQPGGELNVARKSDYTRLPIPEEGLLLGRRLAERLGLRIGDSVTVEVLEGRRLVREIPLTAIADDVLGMSATLSIAAMNTLLREGALINVVALRVDPAHREALFRKLADRPAIATISSKQAWLALFRDRVMGFIVVSAGVLTLFGMLIVVGVVYNVARVTFHERATELASLRVLGFTQREAAGILLTELGVIVMVGTGIGIALSGWVVRVLLSARSTESFEIPPVIATSTYVISVLAVIVTSALSAWLIRGRVDRLDLVAVLKARE